MITFEELDAIFEARGIDMQAYTKEVDMHEATGAGRGYAVASGVAGAVEQCIQAYYPDTDVKIEHADGLAECNKVLLLAKAGKMQGCLIEGMGCPGGCVAGAGTNIAIPKAVTQVRQLVSSSRESIPPKELEEIHLD